MRRSGLLIGMVLMLVLSLVGCAAPSGTMGIQGPQGPVGPQGLQGPRGEMGPQGLQGIQGPQGERGERGIAGDDGDDGEDGDRGPTGAKGDKGNTGDTGPAGPQGPQGEQGIAGATGEVGATGPKGDKGDTGEQGPSGPQGIQGIPGPVGPAGADGAQGPAGEDGHDGIDGIDGQDGEPRMFLFLTQKDDAVKGGDWTIKPAGAWACVSYVPFGPEFRYSIDAYGLDDTEYSLIYYADPYPGNNPGCLIGEWEAGSDGEIHESDIEEELGMSLPCEPDANITGDYSGAPDYYAHARGAKLWLVPSDCYNEHEVTSWEPERFLFETDMITYVDSDCGPYAAES